MFSCHVGCISVQLARSSRTKKERKSSTDDSPLGVLGFLELPAQDRLCLASTWFGECGEGGGVRRWAGHQVVPGPISVPFFGLSCSLSLEPGRILQIASRPPPLPWQPTPSLHLLLSQLCSGKLRQGGEVHPTFFPFPEGGSARRPLKRGKLKREFTTLGKPFLLCNPPPLEVLRFEPKSNKEFASSALNLDAQESQVSQPSYRTM